MALEPLRIVPLKVVDSTHLQSSATQTSKPWTLPWAFESPARTVKDFEASVQGPGPGSDPCLAQLVTRPVHVVLHFQLTSTTTQTHSRAASSRSTMSFNGRSSGARAILGSKLFNRLIVTKVLLVGAGGIGCELRESSSIPARVQSSDNSPSSQGPCPHRLWPHHAPRLGHH